MSQDIKFTNMQIHLYSFIYGEHVDSVDQIKDIRDNLKTYNTFELYAKNQCEAMLACSADFEGISEEIKKDLWEDIVNAQDGKGLLNIYNVLKDAIESFVKENKEEFDDYHDDEHDETEDHVLNMMRRKAIVLKSIKNREMW